MKNRNTRRDTREWVKKLPFEHPQVKREKDRTDYDIDDYEWDRERYRVVSTSELTDSLYVTMMKGPNGPFVIYNWYQASAKWHVVPTCVDWAEVEE